MATRKKIIKVLPHDRNVMVKLYLKKCITIEQYESLPDELAAFTDEWNRITGQKQAECDLLHYMRNERKCSNWVKLGSKAKPVPEQEDFTGAETEAIVAIYVENVALLGSGSDAVGHDPEIGQLLEKSFFEMTGRGLPAHKLIQKLTYLRKRGLLPKVGDMPKPDSSGFDDSVEEPA